MEHVRCACEGKNLSKFIQPVILSIVSGGGVSGYRIVKEVAKYATFRENPPDPTGVYRYLRDMEEKGILANEAADGEDSRYVLTDHGRWCLQNWKHTLRTYIQSLEKLSAQLEETE